MKIGQKTSQAVSSNMKSTVMGMDAAGRDMATYFFRDKIYSNKIRAVVREYAANAADEHNKHNIDRPIEINIEGVFGEDATISFRDYAKGLSSEDVHNIYGQYFRSTKSDSNKGMGGFGVGSKAGHCYTDSFVVVSYFEGKKTTYSCVLSGGDNGVPVGKVYEMGSEASDETGVEVSLQIKPSDVLSFENEVSRFVNDANTPCLAKFIGGGEVCNSKEWEKVKKGDFVFHFKENVGHHQNESSFAIQMGDVVYKKVVPNFFFRVAGGLRLVVEVPIGSVDIPISREGIENTKNNTKVLDLINAQIEALVESDFEDVRKRSLDSFVEKSDLHYLSETMVGGRLFLVRATSFFGESFGFVKNSRILVRGDKKYLHGKSKKPTLVSIPENKAYDYWVEKAEKYCSLLDCSFVICGSRSVEKAKESLSEIYNIVSVKNLKLPKEVKSKTDRSFAFYVNGSNTGSKTALEIHNCMRRNIGKAEAATEEEAKKQNEEYLAQIKKDGEFYNITLNCFKSGGHWSWNNTYYVGSKLLIEDLNAISIYRADDVRLVALRNAVDRRQSKIREKEIMKDTLLNSVFSSVVSDDSSIRRFEKFSKLFDALSKEQSTRGFVINNLWGRWGGQRTKLSKKDIKALISLK